MAIAKDSNSLAAPEDYEGLLKDIMRCSQMMVWISNPQMQVVSGSQYGLDFYGVTAEELRVAQWQDYVHPEDRAQVQGNLQRWLRDHPVIRQEMRVRDKDGKYVWLLDISSPRFAPNGEFRGYLGTGIDITEQKLQALRFNEEMAAISEWEKNRIGGDLHDSLAQAMLGVSLKAMVLENKLKKKDLPEFLIAREMTAETGRVLNGLRKLSQALFPANLSPQEFRDNLGELVERLSQRYGLHIVVCLDPEAVPSDPERSLLLLRIAEEALSNAVRHRVKNRMDVAFKVGGDGTYVLELRYDGAGISGDPCAAGGLGWRLMDHRAQLLGAEVETGRTLKGAIVFRCRYHSEVQ